MEPKDLIPREFVANITADEYSASASYAVDDVVLYERNLYRCKTAMTTAGTFDATKWYQISVDEGMYLHDKAMASTTFTHSASLSGQTNAWRTYDVAFSLTNSDSAKYTTGLAIVLAVYNAGYTGTNRLAVSGTVDTTSVASISVSTSLSPGDYDIKFYDSTGNLIDTALSGGITAFTDVVAPSPSVLIHPSAPSVDFANSTSFPTISAIKTYVDANPDQLMTMTSVYSMIMRFFGRSLVGETLSLSTALGDSYDAATRTVKPADDCTFTGPSTNMTLVIP